MQIAYCKISLLLAVLLLTPDSCLLSPARAEEPLADQVRKSIDRGVQFLRRQEDGRGNWEVTKAPASFTGGWTALAMLALLNAGAKPDEPIMERGLEYLRELKSGKTYVVSLQTMVLALMGQKKDEPAIRANVKWLIAARNMKGGQLLGWNYSADSAEPPDNSNTQYALLALHEARRYGIAIEPEVWQSIQDLYKRSQKPDGSWSYRRDIRGSSLTMTTAGLCGLIISGMETHDGKEKFLPDGSVENCGIYSDENNRPVSLALDWIGGHFPSAGNVGEFNHSGPVAAVLGTNPYYSLYGIERAGRLSGQRFFGKHDWYRVGCEFLVKNQQGDGSWQGNSEDGSPIVATSFALLFLSKGRTPVLISKLAYGPEESQDWNTDRNDIGNLVEFTSRELFKKKLLAWQVFDARKLPADGKKAAAELLQTPIVYITGHKALSLNPVEKEMLREYIENGGFIFVQACCGRPEFDDSFRGEKSTLLNDLFGDDVHLKTLAADHPIYTASGKFAVSAKEFPLEGIDMGCRTVLVYSKTGHLSCHWESNQYQKGTGQAAFQLGANIIAYATGMELPKDRGTKVELPRDEGGKKPPRGSLKVVQLRHGRDWQPAPRAMRNLMFELRNSGLHVHLDTDNVAITAEDVANYKFLYMHGRNEFSFSKEDLKTLQFNLKHGGLLFADACCGSKEFDQSFRKMVRDLFGEDLQPIPLTDELFSKELNGTAITKVLCRRAGADGKTPEAEFRSVDPYLEGIKVNGRWAVIYSKYDIGCALEKQQSTGCLGYDHDSAMQLGKAVVFYTLKR